MGSKRWDLRLQRANEGGINGMTMNHPIYVNHLPDLRGEGYDRL